MHLSRLLVSKQSIMLALNDFMRGKGSQSHGAPLHLWLTEDEDYLLVDGHHRYVEYLLQGITTAEVEVIGQGYTDYWAIPQPDNTFQYDETALFKGLEELVDLEILRGLGFRTNPLLPKLPAAPPWDPNATASGVYITNSFRVASDYATLVASDDDTDPIVIAIDVGGLQKQIDPQALDLLYEPYMQYRYDVVNWARDIYTDKVTQAEDKESRKEIRRQLGPVYEFILNYAVTSQHLPMLSPQYTTMSTFTADKPGVAKAIFYFDSTWMLLPAIREFYQDRAPAVIEAWLGLERDPEESIYNFNSVYLRSNHNFQFEAEFWFFISKFAYLKDPVPDERIHKIYKLRDGEKPEVIFDSKLPAKEIAYHGTGMSRVRQSLKMLLQ